MIKEIKNMKDLTHYTVRINNRHKIYDIESDRLIFSDMGDFWGMQCNHKVDSGEYEKIKQLCIRVVSDMKRIDELNQRL